MASITEWMGWRKFIHLIIYPSMIGWKIDKSSIDSHTEFKNQKQKELSNIALWFELIAMSVVAIICCQNDFWWMIWQFIHLSIYRRLPANIVFCIRTLFMPGMHSVRTTIQGHIAVFLFSRSFNFCCSHFCTTFYNFFSNAFLICFPIPFVLW